MYSRKRKIRVSRQPSEGCPNTRKCFYFKAIYTIYFCTFDINTTVSTWAVQENKSIYYGKKTFNFEV